MSLASKNTPWSECSAFSRSIVVMFIQLWVGALVIMAVAYFWQIGQATSDELSQYNSQPEQRVPARRAPNKPRATPVAGLKPERLNL